MPKPYLLYEHFGRITGPFSNNTLSLSLIYREVNAFIDITNEYSSKGYSTYIISVSSLSVRSKVEDSERQSKVFPLQERDTVPILKNMTVPLISDSNL